MVLFNEYCTTSCGYLAAFISCLSFGSFCVPMKGTAARTVDVDPLVFQSYKTTMCFITSLVLLFYLGVENLTFTPWGIVSGLFWVPAGAAHICGVRTAGLAISHGVSASVIVMVSFSWGMFIFHEHVKSLTSACSAILLMIVGIVGMSYFSAPTVSSSSALTTTMCSAPCSVDPEGKATAASPKISLSIQPLVSLFSGSNNETTERDKDVEMAALAPKSSFGDDEMIAHGQSANSRCCIKKGSDIEEEKATRTTEAESPQSTRGLRMPPSTAPLPLTNIMSQMTLTRTPSFGENIQKVDYQDKGNGKDKYVKIVKQRGGSHAIVQGLAYSLKKEFGIELTVRQMGLLIVVLGNTWGGSVMAPLHLAGKDAKGLNYTFSFALGACIVNILLWVIRYHYHYRISGFDHRAAFSSLPSFHFRIMALPGAMSGILWSIGNMGSIISVTHLGEGVGYSLTQSAMLISGLWGIFWFHEITNINAIRGWMASACLTIAGILLLSYNHMPPAPQPVLKG